MRCDAMFLPLLSAVLAGCTTGAGVSSSPPTVAPVSEAAIPLVHAAIGETVAVDGPRVTPLAVLADSRCPMNARCVWAGEVRLNVRIDLGTSSEVREITSGRPIQVADGTLELVEVRPDRTAGDAIDPGAYRFGFRFMGGL